jgi:hypothetical protein
MALEDKLVSLSFPGGVDTKSDEFHIAPGKLVVLENSIFVAPNRIQKRNGHAPLSKEVAGGGALGAGLALYTLGDRLLLHDGMRSYAWTPARDVWTAVNDGVARQNKDRPLADPSTALDTLGPVPLVGSGVGFNAPPANRAILAQKRSIGVVSGRMSHADMAVHPSGITVVAWEDADSNTGCFHSVIDQETGIQIASSQSVSNIPAVNDHAPKCIVLGQYIVVFFLRGSSLYCSYMDVTSPYGGVTSIPINIATVTSATKGVYDVTVIGPNAVIAVNSDGGNTSVYTLSDSLVVLHRYTFPMACSQGISVFADLIHPPRVMLLLANGASIVLFATTDDYTGHAYGGATVEAATNVASLAGICLDDGSLEPYRLFYTLHPSAKAPAQDFWTRTMRCQSDYSFAGIPFDFVRSLGLAAKPFFVDGDLYLMMVHDSEIQGTYFIVESMGSVCGKVMMFTAAGHPNGANNPYATTTLPEVRVLDNNVAIVPLQERRLGSSGTVNEVSISFNRQPVSAEAANVLHMGGGVLWMWDGAQIVEHGFHLGPEILRAPNPGGQRVYQYTACYEWMDAVGRLHISAPAVPVTHAQANPIDAAANAVTIQLPTLRITSKAPREVFIVPYRTSDGGTTFHRAVTPGIRPPINSLSVDYVSFVDRTPDSALLGYSQLYTTGGVLRNDPSAPPLAMAQVSNRTWLIDAEDPYVLWFSQETIPGTPVEFSGRLTLKLQASTGPAIAIANMDDKTIVFRSRAISYVRGDGPPRTGGDIGYQEIPILTDTGCADKKSLASIAPGLVYKSEKGFFILTRDLGTSYIGADVEAYNSIAVTSSLSPSDANWVMFVLENGITLLYDYLMNQWSVFTGIDAISSVMWNKRPTLLLGDDSIWVETPGQYSAAGAYIPLKLKTPWLQLAGMQGFQRVWEVLIFGTQKSDHTLRVDLAYDYDDTVMQTSVFNGLGTDGVLQWRVQCKKQQCQAIQITITEIQNGLTIGEGLTLSGISLRLGVHRGLARIPASKTKG